MLTIDFNIIGDLKPENLLFTNTSDSATLKLTDFGFAKEGNTTEVCNILIRTDFVPGNNEQRPLNTPW